MFKFSLKLLSWWSNNCGDALIILLCKDNLCLCYIWVVILLKPTSLHVGRWSFGILHRTVGLSDRARVFVPCICCNWSIALECLVTSLECLPCKSVVHDENFLPHIVEFIDLLMLYTLAQQTAAACRCFCRRNEKAATCVSGLVNTHHFHTYHRLWLIQHLTVDFQVRVINSFTVTVHCVCWSDNVHGPMYATFCRQY